MVPESMSQAISRNWSPLALHEQERIADLVTPCLLPDLVAEEAHDLSQDPVRSQVLCKVGIRRTGDRDEPSTRFQHLEGIFEGIASQAIQNES